MAMTAQVERAGAQAAVNRRTVDTRSVASRWMLDPLSDSQVGGLTCLLDVQVLRIVLVALETGARFQREGIALDPLAWMVTPRRMFGGLPAIEACSDVEACSRAILVHGLGLGLDPLREAIDLLMEEEVELHAVAA